METIEQALEKQCQQLENIYAHLTTLCHNLATIKTTAQRQVVCVDKDRTVSVVFQIRLPTVLLLIRFRHGQVCKSFFACQVEGKPSQEDGTPKPYLWVDLWAMVDVTCQTVIDIAAQTNILAQLRAPWCKQKHRFTCYTISFSTTWLELLVFLFLTFFTGQWACL